MAESTHETWATETCCGGLGLCSPAGYVSEEVAARLGQADCQSDERWCVPLDWLHNPTRGPETCRTAGELEGRCLPACLPELKARGAELSQDECEAGHLCAPCYDPASGEDTGACHFEPDPGPSDEPPAARLTPG